MQPGLYRKTAADKLASPERLDLTMQVTSPLGWLVLSTAGVVLLALSIWSVVGRIPEMIEGQGVLLRGERVREVAVPLDGRVESLFVRPGQEVAANQRLAVVLQDRAGAEEHRADVVALESARQMLAARQRDYTSLNGERGTLRDLVDRGLRPENALGALDRQINQVQGEMAQARRDISNAEARLRTTADVTAPAAGRVTEVLKGRGDQVHKGEPLVRLELVPSSTLGQSGEFCGGDVHLVLYVPMLQAGGIHREQAVHVSPAGVQREEYGYILGQVTWTATSAASPDDMREKLKNDALVKQYTSLGPVAEVRACLRRETGTPSGFRWSSSRGPERTVDSGAQCSASVLVAERPPYTYVIPALKRTVGL